MESTFDRLVGLKDNPEKFNAEADKIFEDFISGYEPEKQARLRAMHWRINKDLAKYKDPQARFNHMVKLFFEGFQKFQATLNAVAKGEAIPQPVVSNTVVAFRKPNA